MTQFLPPSLLALFAPRPPIAYLPPEESKTLPEYTGIAHLVAKFDDQTKNPPEDEGHLPMRRKELNRYLSRKRVREHQSKNEDLVKACKYILWLFNTQKGTLIRIRKQQEIPTKHFLFADWYIL